MSDPRDPRDPRDAFDARLQARERLVPPFEDDAGLEPPAELDQIVVARARRALRDDRAAEGSPSRPWLPSWGVPVAIAATLVLSFALVLQMSGVEDVRREVAVLQPPAAAPARPAAAPPDAVPSPAPPQPQPELARSAAPRSRSLAAGTPTRAEAAAAAPEPATLEERAARPAAMPQAAAKSRAGANAADAAVAVGAAGAAENVAAATGLAAAAPAAPPPPPPDIRDDPDRWLRQIAELRADGQLQAARRELAAFAARHPSHAIPPDLVDLLPR
jgi:hypothetical protein